MREAIVSRLTLQIAADHPAGAGHFPGNPIVPGALLLAEVVRHIEQAEQARFVSYNVKSAKFLHPVHPGDTVDIEYAVQAQGVIEFQCAVAGIRALSGELVASA